MEQAQELIETEEMEFLFPSLLKAEEETFLLAIGKSLETLYHENSASKGEEHAEAE